MTTVVEIEKNVPLLSIESLLPIEERITIRSVIELDAIDRGVLEHVTCQLLAAGRSVQDKGPVRIDTDYDAARCRLKVSLSGSLPAVKNVLNHRCESQLRLFAERAEISAVAQIDGMQRDFAGSVAAHLLREANNRPKDDLPLRVDTNYEVPQQRLQVALNGSTLAIAVCLGTIHARLTQRLNRQTRLV